ncbi:leucine-rich repeat domain-containing protein [Microcoleus sp. ARI1-B5]|uniref:leucine-rich repeat domain-containing protein n=1 Tax=unclassified Microcoleus TaxID=2642155 RepID=UPI002FCF2028
MPAQQANQPINFTRFADWCRHKDSLSESARHTVEVLLKQAGTSDCNEAEQVLSNLTELHLPSNQITDITPVSGFTNLTRLHLEINKITDISGLSGLTNLTSLHLESNSITDITGLSALINLRRLYLNNNQITDITGLSALTNLTRLYIANNQITDITGLSALTNILILNLHNNQITDITPVSRLTNLTRLILSSNQITDIIPLSALTNGPEIYLYNNPITDLNLSGELKQKYLTLKTAPIDSEKATEAVKKIYAAIGLQAPKVIVCSSPQVASQILLKPLKNYNISHYEILEKTGKNLDSANSLWEELFQELDAEESALNETLRRAGKNLSYPKSFLEELFQAVDAGASAMILWNCVQNIRILEPDSDGILLAEFDELVKNYREWLGANFFSYPNYREPLTPTNLLKEIHVTEFFISKLGVTLDQKAQELLRCKKQLLEHCGWILPFEKICVICDRPIHLRFDSENRPHAEGEPAIEFADGYSLYFHHGVKLPEQYGKVHPNLWQAQWILSETNAELRRLLIQRIGYDRICQELAVTELDSWQEYTLLSIEFNDDFDREGNAKPVYLLKMTCPSTGHIHALRVPPNVASAQQAIRWVNWDIDSEEFSVQT